MEESNMTNLMEEFKDLLDEVKSYEAMVKHDEETLANDQKYLDKSKLMYAEAIIRLNDFKKSNNL